MRPSRPLLLLFCQSLGRAKAKRLPPSLSLSLSLSLFCDLISARIKHRRTDVHLVATEKAVCEPGGDEAGGDLLNYARGLFRPSRCGFRAAKATFSFPSLRGEIRAASVSTGSDVNLNKNVYRECRAASESV